MQQTKEKFLNEASKIFKKEITESTLFADLGNSFDSMARSELVFAIEDIYGVDMWEKKSIKEFTGFTDLLAYIEEVK